MQLFNQMSNTAPRKKKFLGQLQVERFTNEYSDRHLKGILEEGAVWAQLQLFMTLVAEYVFYIIRKYLRFYSLIVNIVTCLLF